MIGLAELYRELHVTGAEVSHSSETLGRYPDLYVRSCQTVRDILERSGWNFYGFTAADGSGFWLEVPFAWIPELWAEVQAEAKAKP